MSDQPRAEGFAAALSNGFVAFFLVAGVQLVTRCRHRGHVVAGWAAAGTILTVLPVRLIAGALGAEGPIGGAADTALDVSLRAGVVFIVIALTGRWSQ
jgi:hypothetical protein